ncbi:MAG: dockerin type I domain-containing protein [candidate division Zixibacteria bacterium]|nr:dockerin type I domain-containing protein [candidate division Zixibacteria bacterium]
MSRSTTFWTMVCLMLAFGAGVWADPVSPAQPLYQPTDTCSGQLPGDADGDGVITIYDGEFIANYLCLGGPAPNPLANGDPNGDCVIDTLDVKYLYDQLTPVTCTCVEPATGACFDSCWFQHPGDANNDGMINVGDAVFLLTYLYHDGPPPLIPANGDVNGDCAIDYADVNCIMGNWPPDCHPVACTCNDPISDRRDTCSIQYPGDANSSGVIDRDDVLYLFAYLCNEGPAPDPLANGDPNGDCIIDSLDITYLMDALLYGGPAPVTCTCIEQPTGACFVNYCVYQTPGDLNGDGLVNIGDVAGLVSFLSHGAPKPNPLANADVNGDCLINFDDYTCLVQYTPPEFPCRANCTCIFPLVEQPCDGELNGDANGDEKINVADAIHIISYIFRGGPAPTPYAVYSGDPNGDCVVNVGDAVYLISYVFRFGPASVGCFTWFSNCDGYMH